MMSDDEPTHKELLPDPPTISLAPAIPISIAHYPRDQGEHTPVTTHAPFSHVDSSHSSTPPPIVVVPPQYDYETKKMSKEYMNRKYRRKYENPERIRELMAEETAIVENLTTAIEGKMDIAAIGVLSSIVNQLDGNSTNISSSVSVIEMNSSTGKSTVDGGDRQRALFKAGVCPVIAATLRELGGQLLVCEKALTAVAFLCRHSEENKQSVCLENCKGFGIAGVCELIVGAIKRHGDERKIVEAAADAMRCLCALSSNRERLGNAGACEATVRALVKYHQVPDLCGWLCRAIGHLANNNDSNKDALGAAGACENLIMTLQKFPNSVAVCTEVCWAIRQVAGTEDNRARFANDFGPESIMAVYKSHIGAEPFVLQACHCVVNLIAAEDDDLIPRIANSGFIGYALKSVKKLNDSEVLSHMVFNALYYIACDEKCCAKLCTYDILDVLSINLENHAGHEPVAQWGCQLAHKLFSVNGISSKMRTAGLCEMIPSTVQRQAISHTVSSVGCMVIGDLAQDKANQQRLSSAGACECVVGALKRHHGHSDVVYNTCYAIHFLCMTQNNVSWMGAYGACEAVTVALKQHITAEDVATNASSALASLAFKDDGNQARLFTAGACVEIVTALRTHDKSESVTENACRAIYNLCADSQNVSELGNKGACGLVVTSMQTHFSAPTVVTQCLLATYALAVKVKVDRVHTGNTRKLVTKGAIEIVVAIMQKYGENEEVQRSAAMAVTSLARIEANRIKLGAAGACDLVMQAMRTHISSAAVVCKMALAIDALSAQSDGNKVKFIAAGAVDILIAAFQKHEKIAYLVADIFRALVTLSTNEDAKLKIFSEANFKMYVKALKTHEKNNYVAQWGCNLVYCAAIDDHNRVKLGNLKACENVVNVFSKHGVKNAEVAQWASKAIVGLAAHVENKMRFNTTETCTSLTNALTEHYKDAVVAEWATAAIVAVASVTQNRSKLGAACVPLCNTLVFHPDIVAITKLVSEAIFELCNDVVNQNLFYSAGVADNLIVALTNQINKGDPEIGMYVVRAISNACASQSECANKLGDSGVCELIVNSMQTHMYVANYIQWSCAAIASLSNKNLKNQSSFGSFQAIDALSKGLVTHKTSDVVVAQATRAIRVLTLNHPENQLKVSRSNEIIPTLLSVIKRHVMRETIVEHACWILGNIEFKGPSSRLSLGLSHGKSSQEFTAVQRKSITLVDPPIGGKFPQTSADSKGDGYNVGFEETHVDSAGPTPNTNGSVPSTPAAVPSPTIIKPKDIYAKAAYWDLLFTALQSHISHIQACRWICCAISMFANIGKLPHNNICDLILTVLDTHADNDVVLQKALQAVGSLARTNLENNVRLSRGHVCDIVGQIMNSYSEGSSILFGVLPAIVGLTEGNKDNQLRFFAVPNALKHVASILYNELETDFISQWGCSAVAALAQGDAKNQQKLSTVCGYIADVISAHKLNVTISVEACKAISALAHVSITNRNRLGASDVCEMLPMVLSLHINQLLGQSLQNMEQTSLLFWAVKGIADLAANNPNNQTKLGTHGACECLVKIMQKEPLPGEFALEAKLFAAVFWALGNIVRLGKGPSMTVNDAAAGGAGSHNSTGVNAFNNMLHSTTKDFSDKLNLQSNASTKTKNRTRFIECGVSEWVRVILLRYVDNAAVCQWGCRAINNMAKSSKLKNNLVENEIMEVVERVFEKHANNKDVVEWAILAKETLNAAVVL